MVTVVGAGFAGLTLAFELDKLGVAVKIFERQKQVGGLLDTFVTPYGLVETGANALLNDQNVERLFADLQIVRADKLPTAKKRYIFWGRPQRWPLTFKTSARLAARMAKLKLGDANLKPKLGESVAQWGERFVNAEFTERLLVPGLQGVYAGDPARLSATLTLGGFFNQTSAKSKIRGSVAPALGMKALTEALRKRLAPFIQHDEFRFPAKLDSPVAICTNAWTAAEILKPQRPRVSAALATIESLPLTSVTNFYEPTRTELSGFGCLFPRAQGFAALGVLFNTDIFAGRGNYRSETWIFGGALGRDLSDTEIQGNIAKDRARLSPDSRPPVFSQVTRWPRAIPHYTVDWERELAQLKVEPPLYLHGNYLGQLGLARIYANSIALARQIKDR